MDNLDEFLTGNDAPAVADPAPAADPAANTPVADPAPADPAPSGERPRGPDGKFLPKGEEAAPPAAEEQHSIPPKALQEERRKRQELEHQLAELQARLQPQTPPADIFEDTAGWQQQFGGQVVSEAVSAATLNARLDMSEMMVRQTHPDFEDKKAVFLEMMKETPGLQQKAIADSHPWNFAYNYVANHERMEQLSATNVTELEAKLREQIRAELAAEAKPAAPSPEIPDTLADAQSARGDGGQPLHIPTLDEILSRK